MHLSLSCSSLGWFCVLLAILISLGMGNCWLCSVGAQRFSFAEGTSFAGFWQSAWLKTIERQDCGKISHLRWWKSRRSSPERVRAGLFEKEQKEGLFMAPLCCSGANEAHQVFLGATGSWRHTHREQVVNIWKWTAQRMSSLTLDAFKSGRVACTSDSSGLRHIPVTWMMQNLMLVTWKSLLA